MTRTPQTSIKIGGTTRKLSLTRDDEQRWRESGRSLAFFVRLGLDAWEGMQAQDVDAPSPDPLARAAAVVMKALRENLDDAGVLNIVSVPEPAEPAGLPKVPTMASLRASFLSSAGTQSGDPAATARAVLAAQADWGPDTPAHERGAVARVYSAAGYSGGQIAAMFRVSREQIRLDLLTPEEKQAHEAARRDRRRTGEGHLYGDRDEVPCAICGAPTRSKYGVDLASTACRTEYKRRQNAAAPQPA
jgi:hypothetical protein